MEGGCRQELENQRNGVRAEVREQNPVQRQILVLKYRTTRDCQMIAGTIEQTNLDTRVLYTAVNCLQT